MRGRRSITLTGMPWSGQLAGRRAALGRAGPDDEDGEGVAHASVLRRIGCPEQVFGEALNADDVLDYYAGQRRPICLGAEEEARPRQVPAPARQSMVVTCRFITAWMRANSA